MTTLTTAPLALSADAQDLLFREARTANAFADAPVDEELVRAVQELVQHGPTAMNAQPLRVVLVRSDEARQQLVDRMSPGNQAKTLAAPLTAVLAYDVDFHDELPTVFPVFPGARDSFADEGVRHAVGRDNAFLQAGYFIVGLRAAGLAAGPMAGFDADAVSELLFPDGRSKAVLVVNIGHPVESAFPRLPRLSYDEVVSVV